MLVDTAELGNIPGCTFSPNSDENTCSRWFVNFTS